MNGSAWAILVVAKAPVAGEAKTRLGPWFTPTEAAGLAAAALLDTLAAVRHTGVDTRVLALSGDLARAERGTEIRSMLADFTVLRQKGRGFAERLIAAHADAAAIAAAPVLQIGMDTPQVTPGLLTRAAAQLTEPGIDAVLGAAVDGGWWALGLSDPGTATVLKRVAMSRGDTGANTLTALRGTGRRVFELPTLSDVDTPDDVWAVAMDMPPGTYFRNAAERHRTAVDRTWTA
ncbi:MAG TPA: DUF2064 domain-containing protein [Acidimicrobiales bacterium]|jgi:hypothetical protein|nr:DUF2064 domain-containing protein [Acidimicrobiales bacterium]